MKIKHGHGSEKNKRIMTLQIIEAVYDAIETLKANMPLYFKPIDYDIGMQAGITSNLTVQKATKVLFETGIVGVDHDAKGHDTSMRLLITKDPMMHVRRELFGKGKVIVKYADGSLVPRAYYYGQALETLYIKDQTHKKYQVLNYKREYAGTEAMWLTNFKIKEDQREQS